MSNISPNQSSLIIKSKRDPSEYETLTLPNGLRVLLISNKDNNLDSVALSVGVGCYDDTVMGIAHFLEHMLFMGNKKYPGTGTYFKFIEENGGSSNAYTSYNHTNYFYNIKSKKLAESLDIFSGFFSCPLLDKSSVQKEMNAVDSEHKKNILNDAWREERIGYELTNKKTPVKQFSTGCLETLNVPDIYTKLLDFYNNYYSAHIMNLVISSKKELSLLKELVIKYFSDVPRRDTKISHVYDTILSDQVKCIQVVPVKENYKINISWELNAYRENYSFKPLTLISHLLGHEGPNTLTDYLKKKLLINDLMSAEDTSTHNKSIFSLSINLTKKGFANKDHVLEAIYDYITKLQNMSKDKLTELYNENKYVLEKTFDYLEIEDFTGYVTGLAEKMATTLVPVSEILMTSYIYEPISGIILDCLYSILNSLTKESSSIMYVSPTFKTDNNLLEKWYGIEYDLFKPSLTMISSRPTYDFSTINVPRLNPYICTDHTINSLYVNNNKVLKMDTPIEFTDLCLDNKEDKIYWRYDTTKQTPYMNVSLYFEYSHLHKTVKEQCLLSLYYKLVKHYLNASNYEFHIAGYETNLITNSTQTIINVYGYPEKMKVVLLDILKQFHLLSLDEQVFNDIKIEQKKNYENARLMEPYRDISIKYNELNVLYSYSYDDFIKVIDTVTFADLSSYSIFNTSKRVCLIEGNIVENNVEFIAETILFQYKASKPHTDNLKLVNPVAVSKNYTPFNKKEDNNATSVYYNIGYNKICPLVLGQDQNLGLDQNLGQGQNNWVTITNFISLHDIMVSAPFFEELRSQQQLGYIVKAINESFGDNRFRYATYKYLIQSNHKNSSYLLEKITEFNKTMLVELDKLDDETYSNYKSSYMEQLTEPFKSLSEESQYNFNCILNDMMEFNVKHLLIDHLDKLTKEQFIEQSKIYIYNNSNVTVISIGFDK